MVELFALRYHAAWSGDRSLHHRHKLIASPKILKAGNASNVHAAVDRGMPCLDLKSLKELADANRMVLIHEVPDNVSYNKRHMAWTALMDLPDNILYNPSGCKAHLFTRIGTVMFREDTLTCVVYNLQFIAEIPSYHNRLLAEAWKMISSELEIIDGTFMEEEEEEEEELQRLDDFRRDVVRHTYSRGYSFVRSRLGEDSGPGVGEKEQDESLRMS